MGETLFSTVMGEVNGITCNHNCMHVLCQGDIIETQTIVGEELPPPALLVVAGVYDESFAVHLVVSADEDYTRNLITLGDPINAVIWTNEEECGFHDGGIVLGCFSVLGNKQYPLELKLPWLRGAALKKTGGVLDQIAAKGRARSGNNPLSFT